MKMAYNREQDEFVLLASSEEMKMLESLCLVLSEESFYNEQEVSLFSDFRNSIFDILNSLRRDS